MPKISLVALDMDGTILWENRISPATLAAIRDCEQAGVTVALSTGRIPNSAARYTLPHGLTHLPLVSTNGAWVLDSAKKTLFRQYLQQDVVWRLLSVWQQKIRAFALPEGSAALPRVAMMSDAAVVMTPGVPDSNTATLPGASDSDATGTHGAPGTDTATLPSASDSGAVSPGASDFHAAMLPGALYLFGSEEAAKTFGFHCQSMWGNLTQAQVFPQTPEELQPYAAEIMKVVITDAARPELLRDIRYSGLFPELHMTSSWPDNLEIMPVGVTKASGVGILCAHLGIPMSEVMAVGDGENDLEMLLAVGHPVAMGNAAEAVLAAIPTHAPTCLEDGAAWAIQQATRP